jgi:YVTN family beta-propeller protein
LPHGVWPSGDGRRVYVGLENEDKVAAIDTLKNEVIATSPVGQAPQALVYVPDAVPAASGATNSATSNLQPLGVAGQSAQLWLAPPGAKKEEKAPTIVNAIGPIRQVVRGEDKIPRRYLVILPGTPDNHGAAAQVQRE